MWVCGSMAYLIPAVVIVAEMLSLSGSGTRPARVLGGNAV
jgi:hypothetical protein